MRQPGRVVLIFAALLHFLRCFGISAVHEKIIMPRREGNHHRCPPAAGTYHSYFHLLPLFPRNRLLFSAKEPPDVVFMLTDNDDGGSGSKCHILDRLIHEEHDDRYDRRCHDGAKGYDVFPLEDGKPYQEAASTAGAQI